MFTFSKVFYILFLIQTTSKEKILYYSAYEIHREKRKGIIPFFIRLLMKSLKRDKLFYVKFQGDPVGYFCASTKEKAIIKALKANY